MIPSEGCILCGKALRVNGTFILMSHCNFLAITEERGVAESRALRVAFEETQRKRLKPTPAPSFMVTRDTRTRSLTASRTSVAVCENGSVSAPRPRWRPPGGAVGQRLLHDERARPGRRWAPGRSSSLSRDCRTRQWSECPVPTGTAWHCHGGPLRGGGGREPLTRAAGSIATRLMAWPSAPAGPSARSRR